MKTNDSHLHTDLNTLICMKFKQI